MTVKGIDESRDFGGGRNRDSGQVNDECGTCAEHALNRQPPAMAVENMLDQGEPEPGAALSAAFGDIHAIESFGQSRHMLWSDTRPVIAHRDLRFHDALRRQTPSPGNLDALTGRSVFERIFHEV